MKTIPLYQVDAFASELFKGNPAAVCPLPEWLSQPLMQQIAAENNLSETAFFVQQGDEFELRWFTPVDEIPLCGHATLAAGYVLFEHLSYKKDIIIFRSMGGELLVKKENGKYVLDFPAEMPDPVELTEQVINALKIKPASLLAGKRKLMAVLSSEEEVKNIIPDFNLVKELPHEGVIVTAKGNEADFVSRFFVPRMGINEDPVTGSAHTLLTPYWAQQLKKTEMKALQLSQRGGELFCRLKNNRVEMAGDTKLYLEGEIFIPG